MGPWLSKCAAKISSHHYFKIITVNMHNQNIHEKGQKIHSFLCGSVQNTKQIQIEKIP